MKKVASALLLCALTASLAVAQFSAGGDSVYTTPARPTTKDSITYNFYDSDACCCAEFVNPSVSVSDTMVYLSFSVNTAPCEACRCDMPGAWHAFAGGTLKAGRYGIYRNQSLYCPPGTVCPLIALLPVRIGEVVVADYTAAGRPQPGSALFGPLLLSQEKGTVTLDCTLMQPGQMRARVFTARGVLAGEICNGQACAGLHRFVWTCAAPGVYVVSMDINGVAAATRKIIVSR